VVGDLSASVTCHQGNISGLQQVLGFAGLTLGEHRRMLAQPDFVRRVLIASSGEILHRKQTAGVILPTFVCDQGQNRIAH